ncbi:hypothetical protein [Dongia sedimenti]|uniref:Uncharacterized protein n=1 Tax=Dongia sedimenti TaxID=3064282 RepID=A0ABU0YQB4_9PROT|nr:hypothetical protein [Rhodospirillaceae bacterium R-7]
MVWVLGAALTVSFLVLLPIIYDVASLHSERLGELWGYAPNQFLFLLVPFPIAAFAAFIGFRYTVVVLGGESIGDPILEWLVANWPVVLLAGCIVVSALTITDYFFTAKVFDRLEPAYALKALDSAESLRNQVESSTDPSVIEATRKSIAEQGKAQVDLLKAGPRLQPEEILALPPAVYIKAVLDADLQRRWKLLNPTAHALSALQLFAALMTAFAALFSMLIIYLAVKDGHKDAVNSTLNAITISLVAFAVYPICYRYFFAEMQLITNFTSTIRGDFLSAFLISGAAATVMFINPERQDLAGIAFKGLPFLLVIGPSVYSAVAGPLAL